MDDGIAITLILGLSILALAGGWIIGRLMDLVFRAKVMKNMTKKELGFLHIVARDGHEIKSVIINFAEDIVKVGSFIWMVKNSRIYRQDKPERGFFFNYGQDPNQKPTPMRWENGLPAVFVDKDSMKPLEFDYGDRKEIGGVKPDEAGSWIIAYIGNQLAKAMAGIKNQQLFLIICLVLVAGNLLLSYGSYDQNQKNAEALKVQDAKINALNASMTEIKVKLGIISQSDVMVIDTAKGGGK